MSTWPAGQRSFWAVPSRWWLLELKWFERDDNIARRVRLESPANLRTPFRTTGTPHTPFLSIAPALRGGFCFARRGRAERDEPSEPRRFYLRVGLLVAASRSGGVEAVLMEVPRVITWQMAPI